MIHAGQVRKQERVAEDDDGDMFEEEDKKLRRIRIEENQFCKLKQRISQKKLTLNIRRNRNSDQKRGKIMIRKTTMPFSLPVDPLGQNNMDIHHLIEREKTYSFGSEKRRFS